MNTSTFALVVLSSLFADRQDPAWHSDYRRAQALSSVQNKPMALIFGTGQQGWSRIALEGKMDAAGAKLLADKYVCVYANTASPAGKALAAMFDIQRDQGVVLSDRTGAAQAFWHQGQLSNQNLARYLQKYADDQTVVRTTETVNMSRTSFYPSSFGASSAGTICTT